MLPMLIGRLQSDNVVVTLITRASAAPHLATQHTIDLNFCGFSDC